MMLGSARDCSTIRLAHDSSALSSPLELTVGSSLSGLGGSMLGPAAPDGSTIGLAHGPTLECSTISSLLSGMGGLMLGSARDCLTNGLAFHCSAIDSSASGFAFDSSKLDSSKLGSSLSSLGGLMLGSAPKDSMIRSVPDSLALGFALDCSAPGSALVGLGGVMLSLAPIGSTSGSWLDSSALRSQMRSRPRRRDCRLS